MLDIGLIGCGRIATYAHLPSYSMVKEARIVAVADPLGERAKTTAREFGIKSYYGDYRDMLDDGGIDAVDICSPPHLHSEHVVAAAKAGIHVLCEKPISVKIEEAQTIVSAVEKARVKFMVGNTYRFHPLYRKVKEEIDNPELMWVTNVFSPFVERSHWIYDFERSGGILVEQAVHWFDLFRWWSGEAEEICAISHARAYPFENFAISIKYKNGAVATLTQSLHSSLHLHNIGMMNSNKSAILTGSLLPSRWGGILQIQDEKKRRSAYVLVGKGCKKIPTQVTGFLSSVLYRVQDSSLVPFCNEIKHFVNSILENKTPRPSAREGLKSLEIATAAYDAVRFEKKIALPYRTSELSHKRLYKDSEHTQK